MMKSQGVENPAVHQNGLTKQRKRFIIADMTSSYQNINDKERSLLDRLKNHDTVYVAFSGGVDSSVLARAAQITHGEKAVAVFLESATTTEQERKNAENVAREIGIVLKIIPGEEFDDDRFVRNDENRCYHCKRIRFSHLVLLAKRFPGSVLLEGSNHDDLSDFRPGKRAAEELDVRAPLAELGFSKQDVRDLAKKWNLSCWDRPSEPCLATRIDYDIPLSPDLLQKIDQAEHFLRSHGFSPVRVRFHAGNLTRIEVSSDQIDKLCDLEFLEIMNPFFLELGFRFITVDTTGFRSGSMNRRMN